MKVKPNPIAEFFGTSNAKEQIDIAKGLQAAATAPIIDVIVRFDPRVGQIGISIIGGDVPVEIARKILQGALDQLHEQEVKMALSATKAQEQEAIPPQE